MSKIVQLKAVARGRAGKGASRAVRREGLVPGVVYGDKKEAQIISLNYRELEPHIQTGRFMSTLVDLEVDGQTVRAIPRDIQRGLDAGFFRYLTKPIKVVEFIETLDIALALATKQKGNIP